MANIDKDWYKRQHPNAGRGKAMLYFKARYPEEYRERKAEQARRGNQRQACKIALEAQRLLGGMCIFCGTTEPDILEFHHRGSNGKEHRQQIGRRNPERWIIGNPTEAHEQFELVCANCHKKITYHPKQKTIDAHNLFGGECMICGLEDVYTLEFSHINDDGKEHRNLVGNIPDWVLRMGYEEASQVVTSICASCHAKRHSKFRNCIDTTGELE